MSNFSPFELTPSSEDLKITKLPLTNNLKKVKPKSMIFLVIFLLFGLYLYILYFYIFEKNKVSKRIKTNDNCIGVIDDEPWD